MSYTHSYDDRKALAQKLEKIDQVINEFDCQLRNEWGFPIIKEDTNEEERFPRANS